MQRISGVFRHSAARERAKFLKGHGYRTRIVRRMDGYYSVEAGSEIRTIGEMNGLLSAVSNWWMSASA